MSSLLFSVLLFGSVTGKIQGNVIDEKTQEPIPYANVVISNTDMGAATDADGNFFILNVAPGEYVVEVSCLGYGTKIIEKVRVGYDKTARLSVSLVSTPIDIAPVTVISERPAVSKDMVGTTYLVRKAELQYLPVDYAVELVAFQAAVARTDTALHVRGGRATEVQYMIDNVSIIDPLTGDLVIALSKGVIDEVIFLPGGFDVEYGRAMSGIVNMITAHPADNLRMEAYGKTEKIMPYSYDFGYENAQSSVHLPVSSKLKGYLSVDAMRTDDWDPRLHLLPHKQRQDYSIYGKWLYAPSGKLIFSVSGATSRIQFDRYEPLWRFRLDHCRSDLMKGDLQIFHTTFLPDSRKVFNLTLSRLHADKTYGVRDPGPYGLFEDYTFRDYRTLEYPWIGVKNPFGIYLRRPYSEGDYPEYREGKTEVLKANLNTNIQLHRYHEVKAGFEYTYQDLDNFTYFTSDSADPVTDEYHYNPREYYLYLQDNIDFSGVYAKLGCRYDNFSSDIEGIKPKAYISPRLGITFLVSDKFLFRANIGRYAQPPLYSQMYNYYNMYPLPIYVYSSGSDTWPVIGNPNMEVEKTTSYEIGLQGEVYKNLSTTVTAFYKEVSDLIGTRYVQAVPYSYVQYDNLEYANIKGIETIVEFSNSIFAGKVSYTLSYTKGTSSYASEYADTELTQPVEMYYLDFDQRHRIFIQGMIRLPLNTQLYLFGYFGNGFPYIPPGPEGKFEERGILRLPSQKQIDCAFSKSFHFGVTALTLNLEILNLLDERYLLTTHGPLIRERAPSEFIYFHDYENRYYSPAADANHDGLITPLEEYEAYDAARHATDDAVNAYSSPRRARLAVGVSF
jgi:outer membrane receptor protein involved in Fe transport